MGHLAKLVALCFLFLHIGSASALVPVTTDYDWFDWNGVNHHQNIQAASLSRCKSWAYGANYVEWTRDTISHVQITRCTYPGMTETFPGWLSYFSMYGTAVQVCPSNSTSSGSACACNSGYVENSTQTACEVYVDPAIAACAALSGSPSGSYNALHIQGTDMQSTFANLCESSGGHNCLVAVSYLIASEYGGGSWIKSGDGRFTGGTCSPSEFSTPAAATSSPLDAPTENPCPSGSVRGTVNGVSTCSPPTDMNVMQAPKITTAASAAGSSSSPTSGLGSDAPPTAVKVEEQVTCTGGQCTTEKKYTDATGAVVGTVVVSDSQAAFCAENADALVCGGDSGSMSDFCKKNPTALSCSKPNLGELTDQPLENSSVALAITADTGWGAGAGSCPAPRTVQLSTISVSMPFDLLCDFAQGIRPVVIALAWLAAALGFIGFARRD